LGAETAGAIFCAAAEDFDLVAEDFDLDGDFLAAVAILALPERLLPDSARGQEAASGSGVKASTPPFPAPREKLMADVQPSH
jgi:hypothetical protein